MIKIKFQTDCGNAPKKMLLRDFTIAFANNNATFIVENIADDVRWEMVGDKIIKGKNEVAESLKKMLDRKMVELTISNVITHGEEGSINGSMKFLDGTTFGFCDVYTFTNHSKSAKIQTITSYVVAKK